MPPSRTSGSPWPVRRHPLDRIVNPTQRVSPDPGNAAAVAGEDRRRRKRRRLPAVIPLALIVAALLALLVSPFLVQDKMERHRGEITGVAEQARGSLQALQFGLTREMGASRGFLLTTDEAFLERVRQARGAADSASVRLARLAPQLGSDVAEAWVELRATMLPWRAAQDRLLVATGNREEMLSRFAAQQPLYEAAVAAISDAYMAIAARE